MSLIEGIGDEVTNFLVIVISSIIVYLAWRSTNVRDERMPRAAVLIIESNRRRLDRVAQHPVTISILRSSSQQINNSTDSEDLELELEDDNNERIELSEPASLQSILDEVGDLTVGATYSATTSALNATQTIIDESSTSGPQEIIREMDSDNNTDGLRRRRRLSAPTELSPTEIDAADVVPSSSQGAVAAASIGVTNTAASSSSSTLNREDSTDKSANTDNCTNENSENGNVIEEIFISETTQSPQPQLGASVKAPQVLSSNAQQLASSTGDSGTILSSRDTEFRIKLKYLNDDLKLVKGCPTEAVGDFKKRNFSSELSDQKVVRLVFNGHVLQPDTKTLQACGLFDNCVVHCLVHNPRPVIHANSQNVLNDQGDSMLRPNVGITDTVTGNAANVNINEGQRLVYLGIFLILLTLTFCWYFRIQYNHLFSWYSTIGLILLTALFLVIIPLLYLIEREVTA